MKGAALFFSVVAVFAAAEGAVVNLQESDFADVVDGSTNVLVEFYAPWCGHCKNLAPEWEIAGNVFQEGDDIVIAAVDATENRALGEKYGVTGFPTIKFFGKGSTTPEDYDGGRTADTIVSWVNKKIGTNRKIKKAPSAVLDLTAESFDAIVYDPEKFAMVEFYAPWCGHCKNLAPKYEKVAKAFAGDADVVIAKVDATEESDLGQKFEVTGYPTILYFAKGADKELQKYEGPRDEEGIVNFINEAAGTHRNTDGSLKNTAGRVPVLDELVQGKAGTADATLLQSVKEAAASLTGKDAVAAERYVAVIEKVIAKGGDYVAKELKRLGGMMKSSSIGEDKKTGFMLRQNVLNAFV